MKVKITKDFTCYPAGHTARTFAKDTVVEDEVGQMALDCGHGEEVKDAPVKKDAGAAPVNKDAGAAPKNKAKK
jgi:hypothetical protein